MNERSAASSAGALEHDRARGEEFDSKRRAILDAAADVFFRRGFTAGTTKEIAAQVGLSQPAIYHYVGSKEDLLNEIALKVDQDLMGALDRALDRTESDPVAQLRAVIEETTAAICDNTRTFAVYYKEQHSLAATTLKKVQADERAFIERVVEVVEHAQRQGALPRERPVWVLAEAILGMVSWLHRWYRPEHSNEPRDIAEAFAALLRLDA